jgi:fructose-1,6-bisphosphatase
MALNSLPKDLLDLLREDAANGGLASILEALLSACRSNCLSHSALTPLQPREIGTVMRNGEFSHEEVGTTNSSGDEQLHVDLSTEQIIFNKLRDSGPLSLLLSSLSLSLSLSASLETHLY